MIRSDHPERQKPASNTATLQTHSMYSVAINSIQENHDKSQKHLLSYTVVRKQLQLEIETVQHREEVIDDSPKSSLPKLSNKEAAY